MSLQQATVTDCITQAKLAVVLRLCSEEQVLEDKSWFEDIKRQFQI